MAEVSSRRALIAVVATVAMAATGCETLTVHAAEPTVVGVRAPAVHPGGGGSVAGRSCTAKHFRLESTKRAAAQARRLVARMTLSQEVDLMHGLGFGGSPAGTVGGTTPIPALKVPGLYQEDGPGGVGDGDGGVTQLPAPIALAATFDPAAARCYGQVIGTEARGKGISLMYAPTVNLVRVPQWGRAFESFGEDPYLSGTVGRAEIDGIQRSGVMAQVKHFAVYNQESNRNTRADDAIVAERTLQEVYLKVWRLLARSDPASMMCAYSTINGKAACQNAPLLSGFLRHQLHYDGFVGSDYNATDSTVASVNAGLDQEQPGADFLGDSLIEAVHDGSVSRSVVNTAATRILTQMYRFRMFTDDPKPRPLRKVDTPADAQVARRIAEESTVLLKNRRGALPLPGTVNLAVIGPAAGGATTSTGDGTASVVSPGTVTPIKGIRGRAGAGSSITYTAGLPRLSGLAAIPPADLSPAYPSGGTSGNFTATLTAPQTGTYILSFTPGTIYQQVILSVDGVPLLSDPNTGPVSTYTASVHLRAGSKHTLTIAGPSGTLTWMTPSVVHPPIAAAAAAAAKAKTAVVVVGDGQESEAADRASLALPSAQDALIDAVAAANPHTIVVVEAGAAVAMPWLSKVEAVVDQWYPGQTDGTSLAAVLFGAVNPSGHLPVTFPASMAKTPVAARSRFPGVRGQVHYTEGRNIGYRWWIDTHHRPLFPFGFGLSYTRFRYGTPRVTVGGPASAPVVTVIERITNVGHVAGADVAQVYLGFPKAVHEPDRQLVAYQRASLRPGQSAFAVFTLRGLALAYFAKHGWRIPAGRFRVLVGDSSASAQLSQPVRFRLATSVSLPDSVE